MEGLGIEKLSMPFIATCRFFSPLVIKCVTDPMLGKRLQQEIADNCLSCSQKNTVLLVLPDGLVGWSSQSVLFFIRCDLQIYTNHIKAWDFGIARLRSVNPFNPPNLEMDYYHLRCKTI